jgi:hypothetical protein
MSGTAIVSAQVSLELRELLAREATATDRSISAVVRRALREHLTSPAPDAVGPATGRSFSGRRDGPPGAADTPAGAVEVGGPGQGNGAVGRGWRSA